MIILTAFAIGIVAVGMRSMICYVLAGCLIVTAFALASMFSAGSVSLLALVAALVAYNAGIAATVVMTLVLMPRNNA